MTRRMLALVAVLMGLTALVATRGIMDVLATLVNEGKLGRKPPTELPPPPYWPKRKPQNKKTKQKP